MRRIVAMLTVAVTAIGIAGCGGGLSSSGGVDGTTTRAAPLDLTGEWTQTNSSSDTVQKARISASSIEIDWVTSDSTSLYWKGTYKAPGKAASSWSWTSTGDTKAMDKSLLGSQNKTKKFSYSDGILSYKTSVLGTTTTVKLKKD